MGEVSYSDSKENSSCILTVIARNNQEVSSAADNRDLSTCLSTTYLQYFILIIM